MSVSSTLDHLDNGGYKHDWVAVLDLVYYFANGPKRADASDMVIRKAIAATCDPTGKKPEELQAIAAYHVELLDLGCNCPVCCKASEVAS